MIIKYVQKLPDDFQKDSSKVYITIVGGRDVNDYGFLCRKFLHFLGTTNINISDIIFVSGGARSVDRMTRRLAQEMNKDIIEILPDWGKIVEEQDQKEIKLLLS